MLALVGKAILARYRGMEGLHLYRLCLDSRELHLGIFEFLDN